MNPPLRLPRLWNAKRRIKTGRLPLLPQTDIAEVNQDPGERNADGSWSRVPGWHHTVSPDVVQFIEESKLEGYERLQCLRHPNQYFSYPNNVPPEFRRQVYLPKPHDLVYLFRTPHLPPKYASFRVPLWFNKLDMKDYLSTVYGVEVLHVRSFVQQQKVTRVHSLSRGVYSRDAGRMTRPKAKKKMTVELVEPFVYPHEIKDLSLWEQETFYQAAKEQLEEQKKSGDAAAMRPNKEQRKSIAEQAQELLAGKAKWKPTWQSIPIDSRAMQGSASPPR